MLRKFVLSLGFGFNVLASSVLAAPCAGFPDVDDTNPAMAAFCSDVTWIKNRGVTLGCLGGTAYCPNDGVSRLQMAAFMRRLGVALTPSIQFSYGPVFAPAATGAYGCITADIPAVPFPRTGAVMITGEIGLTAPGPLLADPVVSFDGGATWAFINTNNSHSWFTSDGVGNGAAIGLDFNIPPGVPVRAALYFRVHPNSVAAILALNCFLRFTATSAFLP
jgi:hypothetical protein